MRVLPTAACLFALCCCAQGQSGHERQILGRGSALEERGQLAQAKELYLGGLREFPRSSEIIFRIGTLYLRESNWPQAIQYLQRGSALRPRDVDTFYYLAQAYYLDGQHGPARQAILRAVTLAPDRPEVAQKYGEYLCEDNLCTEGLPYLLKARRLDPTLRDIDFDLGMAYHKLAHVPEAQRYLEAALKKDPGNLIATRFLADVLGRQNQWERAKDHYQRVVAGDPQNGWALYGLGRALVALGNYEAALGPLRDALAIDPMITEAHFQLGNALRQLGRRDEAARELKLFKALRERTQASAPAVTFQRAPAESRIWEVCQRFLNENKESEALAYLNSLVTDKPINPHYLLGVLHFSLGQNSDAVRMLARAAEISPSDADVLAFLGRAQLAAGEYDSAEKTLAQALALKPDGELPLVGLGELAYARGDWEQAIRYFEQSKTSQAPVLLEWCRSYFQLNNRAKALEIAELVRAFGNGDPVLLRELDSLLASEKEPAEPVDSHP